MERDNMRHITYDYDWKAIARAMVTYFGIEDGYWQINMTTESISMPLPQPVDNAHPDILPGHMVRITGIQLRKVPEMGIMCIQVRGGYVIEEKDAIDTDQRGPQESGGSIGEDSGSTPVSYPTAVVPRFKPIDAR
jgi:hypothetical protein